MKNTLAISVRLVNYPRETMDSGRASLCEAENLHNELAKLSSSDPRYYPLLLKYLEAARATVVYAVRVVESTLNIEARNFAIDNSNLEPEHIQFLLEIKSKVDGKGNIKIEPDYNSIKEKLKIVTRIISGNNFDLSDSAWQDLEKAIKFRDAVAHYKADSDQNIYSEDIEIPRRAIKATQEILIRFYQSIGKNVPDWINNP